MAVSFFVFGSLPPRSRHKKPRFVQPTVQATLKSVQANVIFSFQNLMFFFSFWLLARYHFGAFRIMIHPQPNPLQTGQNKGV